MPTQHELGIDDRDSSHAVFCAPHSTHTGYAMARVKLGDYYYYGQGTEVNYEAAVGQYRIASDKQSLAQAMFNLAYMYEQGFGLQKVSLHFRFKLLGL